MRAVHVQAGSPYLPLHARFANKLHLPKTVSMQVLQTDAHH